MLLFGERTPPLYGRQVEDNPFAATRVGKGVENKYYDVMPEVEKEEEEDKYLIVE